MHQPKIANNLPQSFYRYMLVIIFILALTARIIPGPRTIDDSYITYRYARNILAGNGFIYNPGEQVLGTTTPLYTILLSGLGLFTGGIEAPFPEIAMVVNAFADGLTCLLLFYLGRRLGSPLAGLGATLVMAIAPYSVTFAIGGLETSLYVLLLTATISAHLSRRHTLAAFLGALSFLTRPDALILLGPLAFDRAYQVWKEFKENKQIKVKKLTFEILAFSIPTLTWIVFSTSYFGSPLPHSIAAKSIAYRLPAEAAMTRLLQHYATPFLGHLTFGIPWIGVGLLLFPFLFLVGARYAWRADPHIWPYLAYPWLYFVVFAIANPLIFRWYLTPPLPAYMLTILIGAENLIDRIAMARQPKKLEGMATTNPTDHKWTYSRRSIVRLVALVGFVILIPFVFSFRGWELRPNHGLMRPAPKMAWYQLELLYRQAADWLSLDISEKYGTESAIANQNSPILAAGDVGVLGFHTTTRILDTVGLNSPQSTAYYPLDPDFYAINYAIPPDLIMDMKPDYIVILEIYGRFGLFEDPRFSQVYSLRYKIPADIYGSNGMLIFERRIDSDDNPESSP